MVPIGKRKIVILVLIEVVLRECNSFIAVNRILFCCKVLVALLHWIMTRSFAVASGKC